MYGSKFAKSIFRVALLSIVVAGIQMNIATPWELMGKEVKTGMWKGEQIEYADGEILFQLKPGYTAQDIQDLLVENNAVLTRDIDVLNIGKAEILSEDDLFQVIEVFNSDPRIEFAEPNGLVYGCSTDWYPLQWALNNTGQTNPQYEDCDIDAPQAWEIERGNSSVIVGIIDSGIPYYQDEIGKWHFDHPDLDHSRIMEKNLVDPPWPPWDETGHGTHIAGIISAISDNDFGVKGVCWYCKLLIIKDAPR